MQLKCSDPATNNCNGLPCNRGTCYCGGSDSDSKVAPPATEVEEEEEGDKPTDTETADAAAETETNDTPKKTEKGKVAHPDVAQPRAPM